MYRTNVARLLLERHMASFRHNRLILLARVSFACQVIFKLPFATLTLSIVFGYHAAFSSIHPFLVYFSMAFLFCLYTIGLYQTSILSGFKVNPVLFIRGGRHLREKQVPMCVLILLALHLMSFMVTYNDKTYYHAGDLNWWHWFGESNQYNENMEMAFKKEIDKITEEHFEIAFLPLDPRQEDAYWWGIFS